MTSEDVDTPWVLECPLCRLFHYRSKENRALEMDRKDSCKGCPVRGKTKERQFCRLTPEHAYASIARQYNFHPGPDELPETIAKLRLLAEEEVEFLRSLKQTNK